MKRCADARDFGPQKSTGQKVIRLDRFKYSDLLGFDFIAKRYEPRIFRVSGVQMPDIAFNGFLKGRADDGGHRDFLREACYLVPNDGKHRRRAVICTEQVVAGSSFLPTNASKFAARQE